jgi:hypothetical protein
LDVTAPTRTSTLANMSAEEEDKKEDKGDHINLKVKDQVRAATRPAQIVQKTRSRSTRHFENIAETSPRPLFRRTTRRFTSRSGRPRSLRRYVTRQIRPSGPRGRSTPLPPRGYPPSSRLFFLIPAVFSRAHPSSSLFLADLHGFLLPQVSPAGCRAFPLRWTAHQPHPDPTGGESRTSSLLNQDDAPHGGCPYQRSRPPSFERQS